MAWPKRPPQVPGMEAPDPFQEQTEAAGEAAGAEAPDVEKVRAQYYPPLERDVPKRSGGKKVDVPMHVTKHKQDGEQ